MMFDIKSSRGLPGTVVCTNEHDSLPSVVEATGFPICLGDLKTCFKVPWDWLQFNWNTHFEELHSRGVHGLFIAIKAQQASFTAVAPQCP